MAIQVMYSFEHIATANIAQLPNVISAVNCAVGLVDGRDATQGLVVTDNLATGSGFNFAINPSHDTSVGAWVVIEGVPGQDSILWVFGNPGIVVPGSADKLLCLCPGADGSLRVFGGSPVPGQGGGLIAQSAAGVLNYGPNQSHYIEMRAVTFGGNAGFVFVWVDGVNVINLGPGTVLLVGASQPTHIMFGNPPGSPRTIYDDVYCNAGADLADGWTYNMGPIRIEGKMANAAGEVTQWAPTTPTGVNFTNINEPTVPNQLTYNTGTTVGQVDLYNVEDITYAPIGVQVDLMLRKTGPGVSTVKQVIRSVPGGANILGTDVFPSTNSKYFAQAYGKNPASGGIAWTMAAFNQAQFGIHKAE